MVLVSVVKSIVRLHDIYSIKENIQPCIDVLKPFREDAVFDSAARLFHILVPR